ncbi:hypothetical protein [Haloquadratum walsbyi]|uniref:hypothetical protein n=1 Tax=Haloquadratum walsbyi TaxID=293091 RepID=UPI0023F0DC2E|nr:hypothetical protein [Haloquadratum walsbyi]
MHIRDWQDILTDVTEADVDPDGWRAVAGTRQEGLGEDLFLGHPNAGVYELKTYAKNPRELRGVGTQVARRIDDELDPLLPQQNRQQDTESEEQGRFAVQSPPSDEEHAESMAKRLEETVRVHSEAPTSPDDFFTDVMDALESPAFGPMKYEFDGRPEELNKLTETFEDTDDLLAKDLDDLVESDEVSRGFQ